MADEKDTKGSKGKRDSMAWLQKKAAEAEANIEKKAASTSRELFLPGFDIGAMPNHLNRSSFIAPVARGRRKLHHQTVMVSRGDCVLEYTGEQLDESDADVLMALIDVAQAYPLGTLVPLNRAELLRKLGRANGKHDYEWLYRSMKRLGEGTLFLEARKPNGTTRYSVGRMELFHILQRLKYGKDEEMGDDDDSYGYVLDPRWVVLFSNREYSLIDWDKRMQMGRGQDMAKTLQRLVATSNAQVQRYALDWLKAKMEYGGRLWDFRSALTKAVAELVRLDIITKGCIEDSTKGKEQLVLWLTSTSV